MYKYDDEVLGVSSSARSFSEKEITHVVAKGDTLYSISRLHNVSVEELQTQNDIDGTTIAIGQILKIKTE